MKTDTQNGLIKTDFLLAQTLGCTRQTIYRLKQKHGLRKKPDGGYDLEEARALLDDQGATGKSGTSQSEDAKVWDVEYRKYKALAAEAEYKKTMDELVERAVVVQAQIARELEFKRAVQSIHRVAARLVGKGVKEIEAILVEHEHAALRKLSRATR